MERGWRAILDLKKLNVHLVYKRFKMSSSQSILEGIWEGDFLTSIYLTETYLHVLILPAHRQFLQFYYAGHHYQYRVLPFWMALAPRSFTKVLAAHLRSIRVRLQYLDDILIQAPSPVWAKQDLQTTIQALQDHSFLVNFEKSHLVPTTRLLHLRAVIDTRLGEMYLSQECQDSLVALVNWIR